MEIFEFKFSNYYLGPRTAVVLSTSKDDALELLRENPEYKRYVEDEETELKTFTKRFICAQVIGLY